MADRVETIPDRPRAAVRRAALAGASFLAALALVGLGRPGAARLAEVALCTLAWEGSVTGCAALLRRRGPALSPLRLAGAVLLASLPATAAGWLVLRAFGEGVSPAALYVPSLALGLLLAFARRGFARAPPAAAAPPPMPAAEAPAVFLRRHAPGLAGGRLLALTAEDHYLRLHTSGGSALVLMRLRDAVAALGPEAGWQPHRSHWVAASAPARAERDGPNWRLVVEGGPTVPVSRANLPRLRARAAQAGSGPRPG